MGSNRELVNGAYAAFGRGDIPAILGLLDEDVAWSAPETLPQGGEFKGRDAVLKFFEGMGAAWESLAIETEAVEELGADRVVGILRGSGSVRGGRAATYGAVHVFEVRDAKIIRFREFVDLDRPITP